METFKALTLTSLGTSEVSSKANIFSLNGMQFDSKDNQETSAALPGKGIPSLTSSMDRRLVKVIKEDWGHIWEENQEFGRKTFQMFSLNIFKYFFSNIIVTALKKFV